MRGEAFTRLSGSTDEKFCANASPFAQSRDSLPDKARRGADFERQFELKTRQVFAGSVPRNNREPTPNSQPQILSLTIGLPYCGSGYIADRTVT